MSVRLPLTSASAGLLLVGVVFAGTSGCLPDVPTLGRTCVEHADCGVEEEGFYCARNEGRNVCLVGEWPPEADNQLPVLQSALIVARLGAVAEGVLVAFDFEGDEVRFDIGDDHSLPGIGTLVLEANGAYRFTADPGLQADDGDTLTVYYTDRGTAEKRDSDDDPTWVRSEVFIQVVTGLGSDVQEWTGSVSSFFDVPDNWDPSDQIPDADTSVIVAQTANPLSVDMNRSIGSFFSSPGSRVVIGDTAALTVFGTRLLAAGDVEGGKFILSSSPELAGVVPSLTVTHGAALVAPLTVTGDLALTSASPGDAVTLGNSEAGLALIVRGSVRTTPQSAGFSMRAPSAALIVDGDLRLEGAASSTWEEGVVRVRGDVSIGGDGLFASEGLTVLLDGDTPQRISLGDSLRSRFATLELAAGTDVTVDTDMRVTETFGLAGHLSVTDGARIEVQGTLEVRETFTATNAGGTIIATNCDFATNLTRANFGWIQCNQDIAPVDAGPEPDVDAGPIVALEILDFSTTATAPILAHETTVLSWETRGASECWLDGDNVPVNLEGAPWTLTHPGNRAYQLVCTNGVERVESAPLTINVQCTATVQLTETLVIFDEATLNGALPPPEGPNNSRVPGRCFSLYGSVIVQSLGSSDLSPLYGLTVVDGHLIVAGNEGLTSLRGFDLLSDVVLSLTVGGGDVGQLGSGNANLTSLSSLLTLERVGESLNVGGNDNLLTLHGLKNVALSSDVLIAQNASLRSLDGILRNTYPARLEIFRNGGLYDPTGLESIVSVQRSLLVVDNDALTDLPLRGLQSVGRRLVIRDNDALTHLDLSGLTDLGTEPDGQLPVLDGGFIEIELTLPDGGFGGILDGGPHEVLVEDEEPVVLDISNNGCLPTQVVDAVVSQLSDAGPVGFDIIDDDNGPCVP